MSENIRGITFAEQAVTPADDAIVRRAILGDGVLTGCEVTYSGSTLTLAPGYIIACGRSFQITTAQNFAVVDATSGVARLLLTIDLTQTATESTFNQISFGIEYAAAEDGLVDLLQEDINLSGTKYQIVCAVVSLGTGGITGIVSKLERTDGGGGGLNFKVVPGLTQPGTASENTIWVKTERINGWRFSAVKPKESRFRYIKLQMDSLAGEGATVQFADVRFVKDDGSFFAYPSGTSVTASIPAASTEENESKLVDNNASTKYCSAAWVSGSYVLIDLGASGAIDITQYKKWRWYTAADATTYPERNLKNFSLWGSNDGSVFELLDSVTGYNAPSQNAAVAYTGTIYEAPNPEPVNGEVLFVTGTSSKVEFNALKKNAIQIYPVSAYQYDDGSYVKVPAMSYQNGKWNPWYIEIFALGKGSVIPATAKARTAGKGSISVSNNEITIGYNGDWAGTDVLYYTDEPIDISGLNELKLTAQISEMRTDSHFTGFGLIQSIPPATGGAWEHQNWVATTEISDNSNVSKEFSVNISTVPPGQYYFLFIAAATRGKITDIRIE